MQPLQLLKEQLHPSPLAAAGLKGVHIAGARPQGEDTPGVQHQLQDILAPYPGHGQHPRPQALPGQAQGLSVQDFDPVVHQIGVAVQQGLPGDVGGGGRFLQQPPPALDQPLVRRQPGRGDGFAQLPGAADRPAQADGEHHLPEQAFVGFQLAEQLPQGVAGPPSSPPSRSSFKRKA